jgi:formylglycine-generating enzyme required for sulfatase activity
LDDHPVTVAEFRRFVKATGHVTEAERQPDPVRYPDADIALLVPGFAGLTQGADRGGVGVRRPWRPRRDDLRLGRGILARGKLMANTWQGEFPWQNLRTDRYEGTSPVGSYPPNGYGRYDMAGNVWE